MGKIIRWVKKCIEFKNVLENGVISQIPDICFVIYKYVPLAFVW